MKRALRLGSVFMGCVALGTALGLGILYGLLRFIPEALGEWLWIA